MKEKEASNDSIVDTQLEEDKTLYLVERLSATECYRQKHLIMAAKYYAKKLDGEGSVILPTHYCTKCKKYFIGDKTLKEYEKQFGKLLVQKRKYYGIECEEKFYDTFNPESQLHQYGYNVKKDELTDIERQKILVALIESGQLSYHEICRTIEQCISLFQSQNRYSQAITKWKKDLKFIGDYIKMIL